MADTGVSAQELSNEAAVKALNRVAELWIDKCGLEAHVVLTETRLRLREAYIRSEEWAKDASAEENKGDLARHLLQVLLDGERQDVRRWVRAVIQEERAARAHVLEPLSLLIGGGILIGAILAARVKRIGSVEFYEGIPENLEKVLKVGSSIAVPRQ